MLCDFQIALLERDGLVRWPFEVVFVTRHKTTVHFDVGQIKPIRKTAKYPKHIKFNPKLGSTFKDLPSNFFSDTNLSLHTSLLEKQIKIWLPLPQKFPN